MDAEKAGKIGRAFALGYVYGHGVLMAQDDAQWITVHPNGKGANANGEPIKGRPVLIDSDTGEILGGAGGKFTGRHISAMPKGGKHEQPGAQMVINRAHLKKEHPEMFAPKQNKSAESRSDKRGKTSAATPASSYKEADERVKQIQEQQKDIDRQIHSLVSSIDWFGGNHTPEAEQALSQIAKLRSDYAKLNDDLGSAIKERAALEKPNSNFTHATTGRSENEITSSTWEREQKRRQRNFMANTFGTSSSETPANATKKETNGLKIKQPEKSEISLPKPAVPANWREMSYGEQFAAKMDMQKQFLTPDLDYSKLSEKDLNTYERVAKEAANERDRYFDGKTVTTNADLAQKRLDQIQDYKTYRGSALKSQEAAADVRQYGKLWESSDGRVKRLYLKPYNLGLKTEKYKTGNIKSATVNGEPISNSRASGLLNMEAYINLKTGKLEGSDAREFSKYFGKDIDKIISDNFSVGGAS